jgi:hypothetical protein
MESPHHKCKADEDYGSDSIIDRGSAETQLDSTGTIAVQTGPKRESFFRETQHVPDGYWRYFHRFFPKTTTQ